MNGKNQENPKVYLDYNASAPLSGEVLEMLASELRFLGNPSSIHWSGRQSKAILREARRDLAQRLGVHPLEIVFTSGASESNSWVLYSLAKGLDPRSERSEFVASQIEHPCIERGLQDLELRGFKVHRIPVSREGQWDLEFARKVIGPRTRLVTAMWVNNETGIISPIDELSALAHQAGAKFHTDAVQAFGKIPVRLDQTLADYVSLSGHKLGALKGIGALFVRKGAPLETMIFGGGQERFRRGGTENVLGIQSFRKVLGRADGDFIQDLSPLRAGLEKAITSRIPGVRIVGADQGRVGNTSLLLIDDIDGETLLMALDLQGFAVSTGAACSSGSPEPSPVLLGMGFSRAEAQTSLRVSLGWETRPEEVNNFVTTLAGVVLRLRGLQKEMEASL